MKYVFVVVFCLFLIGGIFVLPVVGSDSDSQVLVSYHPSEVRITADSSVPGYVAKGIVNAAGLIKEAAKEAAEKALNAAKEKLGIHSPSRVFEVEVGKMIDLGLAAGIEKNSKYVTDTMKALSAETVRTADTDLISYTRSASGSNYKAQNNESIDYDRLAYTMVKAMKKSGINMNVDGRDFGRLIERYK